MYLIRVRFLKEGKPSGKPYTYKSRFLVKPGDLVQVNDKSKAVVTDIILDFPLENIKEIKGVIEKEEDN